MKQDSRREKLGADSAILVIAGILLVGSLYLLFKDIDTLDDVSKLTHVGKFSIARNDVRRKVDSGFSWSNVGQTDDVYEGDSIFTGDDSEASIHLSHGGFLSVDPNSLIVIRTKDGKVAFDLQYGSLAGRCDGSVLIGSQGQYEEVLCQGAEIKMQTDQSGKNLSVQVLSGEAEVVAPTGQKKKIRKDQVAKMGKSSTVVEPDVKIVSPLSGRKIWLAPGAPLEFKWEFVKKEETAKSRLEISRSASFDKIEIQQETEAKSFSFADESRPQGSFYWRVRKLSKDGKASGLAENSLLTVYSDIPPMPLIPTQDQKVEFEPQHASDKKQVIFNWEDSAGSTGFEIQVARNLEFTDLVVNQKIEKVFTKEIALPLGQFHWRIKGINPERPSPPWSRVISFELHEPAPLEAPLLAENEIQYVIPQQALDNLSEEDAAAQKPVTPDESLKPFTWSPVPNAAGYEVEISEDESFSPSEKVSVSEKTQFSLNSVKAGSVFVKVRAKSPAGRVGAPSAVGQLTVMVPPPVFSKIEPVKLTFKSKEERLQGRHDFDLNWTPSVYADGYELQWSEDQTFSDPRSFTLEEPKHKATVTRSGTYQARVRSIGKNGKPISDFSAPLITSLQKEVGIPIRQTASVPKPPAPKPNPVEKNRLVGYSPKILEPRRNTSLVTLESSKAFVSFKWREIKGADGYEIEIAEDADFTKMIKSVKIMRTTYVLQSFLPEGRVFWRVRAQMKSGSTEWSDVHDIRVIYE